MPTSKLTALLSDEFDVAIGPIVRPPALRRVLAANPAVRAVTGGLASGEISETSIEEFVRECIAGYAPGQRVPGELALAAVAVAIERTQSEFAQRFLELLRGCFGPDLRVAPRVAAECLEWRRTALAQNQHREAQFRGAATVEKDSERKKSAATNSPLFEWTLRAA